MKEGEDLLLKKGTSKDSQCFAPYQNKPFCVPHMGATPHKAVTNRFPQVGGNQTSEAPGVVLDPTTGSEGVETPPPMTP